MSKISIVSKFFSESANIIHVESIQVAQLNSQAQKLNTKGTDITGKPHSQNPFWPPKK